MSTEDTDTTPTQETVFFNRKYRVAVFCAFAIAVPFIMFGAKQAWDSNANRVEDWLPAGFSETQKLYWFSEHFGSDELLMVSWPGCNLDDTRLDRLADALVFMMRDYDARPERSFLNVGVGQDVSIAELAAAVAQVVGYDGEVTWDASMPDGTPRKLLDVSALQALGWRARTSLAQGLRLTYDWFCETVAGSAAPP